MKKPKKLRTEKKEKPAQIERRVRVTFFLVAELQQEVDSVKHIIDYLYLQYWWYLLRGEWDLPVTGFTHSFLPNTVPKSGIERKKDSVFAGYWWSEIKLKRKGIEIPSIDLMEENVVLFVIDLPVVVEEWKFDNNIARLKREIFSAYARNKRPQEEIWIVKQDIYRYA